MMAAPAIEAEKGGLAVSLAECKAYLRLERDDEDAVLAGFIRTAMALCEAFTGQWLIARAGEQRLAADGCWQRIGVMPVTAISGVIVGGVMAAPAGFEIDIDLSGTGWVRLLDPAADDRPLVQFRAGLGDDWNSVPEPLRHGIVRLVAHLFTHRDAADAGPASTAVAAMWRPWRRVRLT